MNIKKVLLLLGLLVVCVCLTACGNYVKLSETPIPNMAMIKIKEVLPCQNGYAVSFTAISGDFEAESDVVYTLKISSDFIAEMQTFEAVGARNVTQYMEAKEFYNNWWKNGLKNSYAVEDVVCEYSLDDFGDFKYISEYDYYKDNDVTGMQYTTNEEILETINGTWKLDDGTTLEINSETKEYVLKTPDGGEESGNINENEEGIYIFKVDGKAYIYYDNENQTLSFEENEELQDKVFRR